MTIDDGGHDMAEGERADHSGTDDEAWARQDADRLRAVTARIDAEPAQMRAESEASALRALV